MTHPPIALSRLRNLNVDPVSPPHRAETPAELVTRLGAVQAQDYPGAKWSLGHRLPGTTEADIDRAIDDRTIVRTWPMRGTLHFVPAADVSWMLDLMTPRVIASSAARQLQLGLDDATFAACRTVFREALEGGQTLTREELLQALEWAGIPTGSQRGYHLLWRTAQEGLICFASPIGKKPSFALLDEWIPPSRRVSYADRNDALHELAVRYFTSHGPATLQDFSWWSGLLAADAKTGLEAAKPHLEQSVVEGKAYWMPPGSLDAISEAEGRDASLYLLPGFDEFILGYRNRSAVLDPTYAEKICPGSNGVFMPTIVSNGIVVGTWKRAVTKKGITVTACPFRQLSGDEEQAFAAAADRYRHFLTT